MIAGKRGDLEGDARSEAGDARGLGLEDVAAGMRRREDAGVALQDVAAVEDVEDVDGERDPERADLDVLREAKVEVRDGRKPVVLRFVDDDLASPADAGEVVVVHDERIALAREEVSGHREPEGQRVESVRVELP